MFEEMTASLGKERHRAANAPSAALIAEVRKIIKVLLILELVVRAGGGRHPQIVVPSAHDDAVGLNIVLI